MSKDLCPNGDQYTRCVDLTAQRCIQLKLIMTHKWHKFHLWSIRTLRYIIDAAMISYPNVKGHEQGFSKGLCPNGGQYTRYGDLTAQCYIQLKLIMTHMMACFHLWSIGILRHGIDTAMIS